MFTAGGFMIVYSWTDMYPEYHVRLAIMALHIEQGLADTQWELVK